MFKIPVIKFESHQLTSFAGLVIYQPLLQSLDFKAQHEKCINHLKVSEIFCHHIVMLLLIFHLLMGFRRLRDLDYYQDDPLVKRLLGLKRLPDVSTVSRALRTIDNPAMEKVRELCRNLIIARLQKLSLSRLTLDFDGSVLWTLQRRAEMTAIGYNKKKKETEAITICSAPLLKPAKYLMSCFDREMFMTPMGHGNLLNNVYTS